MKGKPVIPTKTDKKENRRQLKWLFGGLTEKQLDYSVCFVVCVIAVWYTAVSVDWEHTLFPRALDAIATVTVAPHSAPMKELLVSETREATPVYYLAAPASTLLLFHSELLDGHNNLVKRSDANLTTQGFFHSVLRNISSHDELLGALYNGTFSKVVWVTPSWSKHFLGQGQEVNSHGVTVAVGKGKDGSFYIRSPFTYFAMNEVATANPLVAPDERNFTFQVASFSTLRRRKTTLSFEGDVVIDIDLSWVRKTDPVNDLLKILGVDGDTRKYIRSYVTGYVCLNETDPAAMVEQYVTLRGILTDMVTKEAIKLPRDMYAQRFAPQITSILCDASKAHKTLRDFHFTLAQVLNETHGNVIRAFGLPLEAGTTARFGPKQADAAAHDIIALLGTAGIPAPRIVRLTDEWHQRSDNVGATFVQNLQKLFGGLELRYATNETAWTQGETDLLATATRPHVKQKRATKTVKKE